MCVGLDELICVTRGGLTCPPDMIACGGNDIHECVELSEWCDGVNDCFNGEDESNCSKINYVCTSVIQTFVF